MALIPPFFLDCVTAIGFRDQSGKLAFGATGFLYGRLHTLGETPDKSRYHVYLVTNRHVFQGSSAAVLRFNPAAGVPARDYDLSLIDSTGQVLYSLHPDPEIDIAVIDINVQLLTQHGILFNFFHSDQHVLPLSKAQQAGIAEGDGVFVLGFPLGDTGGERNYVVARQGNIARIRDAIAGASKSFLIDASIFPGNSGGPVVTRPESMAITGTTAYDRSDLIGVVAAYVPYQDVAISQQTKRPRIIFEENSGLAVVMPLDRVIEVVDISHAAMLTRRGTQEQPTAPRVI